MILKPDDRLFILLRGLVLKSSEILPLYVAKMRNDPADGDSIHMDIQGGHEDTDLESRTFEEFQFFDVLAHNDLSVRRRNHKGITHGGCSFGIAEEIERKAEEKKGKSDDAVFQEAGLDKEKRYHNGCKTNAGNGEEDIIAIFCDHSGERTHGSCKRTEISELFLKKYTENWTESQGKGMVKQLVGDWLLVSW